MKDGDISASVSPRLLFEFEGLIARIPDSAQRAFSTAVRLRRWRWAIEQFEQQTYTARMLVDLLWRRDFRIDVVTFLPDAARPHLVQWLDDHAVPYGHLYRFDDRGALSRALAVMPEVAMVGYADERSRFAYGTRGRLCVGTWNI